jgi:hypothetical protein
MRTLLRTYTEDYAGWVEDTACAIEQGRFSEIDRSALADEVRDLGKTERRELESALEVLLTQMLKARYQPQKKTRSWELTMRVQRKHIGKFLRRSPSLQPELPELIQDAYDTARLKAADETGMETDVFPEACEWTVAEVLADAE